MTARPILSILLTAKNFRNCQTGLTELEKGMERYDNPPAQGQAAEADRMSGHAAPAGQPARAAARYWPVVIGQCGKWMASPPPPPPPPPPLGPRSLSMQIRPSKGRALRPACLPSSLSPAPKTALFSAPNRCTLI